MALATRMFLAVVTVAVAIGNFGGNALAAEETQGSELSRALAQVRLFSALTDHERAALESAAGLRHSKGGDRIIEQGKLSGRMFIVLDAQMEVRVNGKVVASLPEQSLVGDLEFLDALPASADVVVLRKSRVIEMDNGALTTLMKSQPRLGYVLMREIAKIIGQRLRAMNPKGFQSRDAN